MLLSKSNPALIQSDPNETAGVRIFEQNKKYGNQRSADARGIEETRD